MLPGPNRPAATSDGSVVAGTSYIEHGAQRRSQFSVCIAVDPLAQDVQHFGLAAAVHKDDKTEPEAALVLVIQASELGVDVLQVLTGFGSVALFSVRGAGDCRRVGADARVGIDELDLLVSRERQRNDLCSIEQLVV